MGYRVAIVVDPDFGPRLSSLAERLPVWVCATDENRRHAERSRAARSWRYGEDGVTTFRVGESDTPEAMLIGVLYMVDLHHGEYSHAPPWDTVEVFGVAATHAIREALAEYGVTEFHDTPEGFRFSRPITGAA